MLEPTRISLPLRVEIETQPDRYRHQIYTLSYNTTMANSEDNMDYQLPATSFIGYDILEELKCYEKNTPLHKQSTLLISYITSPWACHSLR